MLGRKKRPSRLTRSPWPLGLFGVVVLLVAATLIFTKNLPFTHDFRISAVVNDSVGLRKGSPVRIAGVDVGKVTGFEDGPGNTRELEMELSGRGLPVHRDATIRIRPRLFLEGGFYVELSPGSPSGPILAQGRTLPLTQTTGPVQFSQVLGVLDSDGRTDLQRIIASLDTALGTGGAKDAAQTAKPIGDVFRDGAIVARAAQGTRPDDLSRTIKGSQRVQTALASRAVELGGALDALATTSEALAAEQDGLRGSLRELDEASRVVPARLVRISRSLASAEPAIETLRPGLRQARKSIPGVTRLLRELQLAAQPAELPALLADLRPTLAALPPLTDRLRTLLPLLTPVTDCLRDRAIPVLEAKLDDGKLSTGRPIWQEVGSALPGLAGASGSFDANGAWVRYNSGIGENTVSTGSVPLLGTVTGLPGQLLGGTPVDGALNTGPVAGAVAGTPAAGVLSATSASPPTGSRPTWLGNGRLPPFRPDVACATNTPPNLQARTGGGNAMASRPGVVKTPSTMAALEQLLGAPDAPILKQVAP